MTEERGYNVDANEERGCNVDVTEERGCNVDVTEERGTEPKIGMKFDSLEELCDFYKSHAREMGFPIRKSSNRKNVCGELRSYTIVCAREGANATTSNKPLKPEATIRCGCLARCVARLDLGKWVIGKLVLEHNHGLNPDQSRFFRCNTYINPRVRNQLDLLDRSGVRLNKSYNSLVNEVGGHENMTCSQKDCRNLIDNLRRLRLGEGDASAIMKYFTKMVSENSGFFFEMDLDDEGHLRNVFWADGRSREAYKEFGDVISFDTTYLVNKFDMPFAPFVGVNHHGQTTLFGCGLVAHEDTESFVWLFSKWLECMSGNAPPAIITDQDKAMKKAIEIVFPSSRHRWCIWHVMKKLPEKFKSHRNFERITYTMKKVVYDTQYPSVFETKWKEMLQKYDLFGNEWLKGLYEERERWIPCYVKDTFWAGMSSTQRSESINAFFDEYIHSKTTLKQFVEQYEVALRDKVEKEARADAHSFSKKIPTCTMFEMEKQIQESYTLTKYKEFQSELTATMYCQVSNEGNYVVYEWVWIEEKKKRVGFDVNFESNVCEVFCSCKMFEFKGILCRHAISVLIHHGVHLLPGKYIIRRWRKDVRRAHTSMKVNVSCWRNTIEHERYNKLNILFSEVADRAVQTEDEFNDVNKLLVTKLEMLKIVEANSRSESKSFSTGDVWEEGNDEGNDARGDGNDVRGDVYDEGNDVGGDGYDEGNDVGGDGYDEGNDVGGDGYDEGNDVGGEGGEGIDVLDPIHTRRKGRPRCTRLQAKRRNRKSNHNSEGNYGVDDVGDDVPTPTTKRRGRPPGSKNKKHNNINPSGDGVQQSQGQCSTRESVVSNVVPPWGIYPNPSGGVQPWNPNSQPWYPNSQPWYPNSQPWYPNSQPFAVPNSQPWGQPFELRAPGPNSWTTMLAAVENSTQGEDFVGIRGNYMGNQDG